MGKPTYDSTVARIAGNIASGLMDKLTFIRYPAVDIAVDIRAITVTSVTLARAIVAEVQRTELAVVAECGLLVPSTGMFCVLPLGHKGLCQWTSAVVPLTWHDDVEQE